MYKRQDIGSSTGYFGASWTTSSLVGTGIVVRGYPVEKNAQMWSMSGSIAAVSYTHLDVYKRQALQQAVHSN